MKKPNQQNQLPLIPDEEEIEIEEEYFDDDYEKIVPDDTLYDYLEECERQYWEQKARGEFPWDNLEDIY